MSVKKIPKKSKVSKKLKVSKTSKASKTSEVLQESKTPKEAFKLDKKDRGPGGRFKKGFASNPAGRPKGIEDSRTLLRAYVKSHSKALIDKSVELALGGDIQMLKTLVSRFLPACPVDNPIDVDINTGTAKQQATRVTEGMSKGEISPLEGRYLLDAVEKRNNINIVDEMKLRLEKIEAALNK